MITGPLVAPSANFEGAAPAVNIKEAQKYFGDRVDFYVDRGRLQGRASTLINFSSKRMEILRQGSEKIQTTK
jgi:L-threonylcarbamoyladenylate synthase